MVACYEIISDAIKWVIFIASKKNSIFLICFKTILNITNLNSWDLCLWNLTHVGRLNKTNEIPVELNKC